MKGEPSWRARRFLGHPVDTWCMCILTPCTPIQWLLPTFWGTLWTHVVCVFSHPAHLLYVYSHTLHTCCMCILTPYMPIQLFHPTFWGTLWTRALFLFIFIYIGWLRLVGSIKLQVSFAEYRLFYWALLSKRPTILSILLIVILSIHPIVCAALLRLSEQVGFYISVYICTYMCMYVCIYIYTCIHMRIYTCTQWYIYIYI